MLRRSLGATGLSLPVLGFGASPLGEEFGPIDEAEGTRAVHAALDSGLNYFDTSPFYGRSLSETRLGAALEGRRKEAVISTKAGRYDLDDFDFSGTRIRRSIDESLKRLRTDYVDILLIHDIEFGDRRQILDEAVPAALAVRDAGKARFVGVSGLQLDLLAEVAGSLPIDVVLSYARYNLAFHDLDTRLRPTLEERNVGLINASPLLLGAFTEAGPPDWHPASAELLAGARKAAQAAREDGLSIAAVALKHSIDYQPAASTLVGMSTRRQLEANLAALEAPVNPAQIAKLRALLEPFAGSIWPSGRPENQDRPPQAA